MAFRARRIYQHWYEANFSAGGCRAHRCWQGKQGAGAPTGASSKDALFFAKTWRQVCRPQAACSSRPREKVPASETSSDFFLLSEIRLYVLHAMGLINWVWY
jgi:hypothetical protein